MILRLLSSFGRLAGLSAFALFFAGELAAQSPASVTGRVVDESGAPIAGAQVVVRDELTGLEVGALTQADGRYAVGGLRAGATYTIEVQVIGFGTGRQAGVTLGAGESRTIDFTLGNQAVALDAIEVFAERAIERRTPVAYTDIQQTQIQRQLGSRDIPMVLTTTPSVYATQQGGGAGDARVNVRGFNQRNVAIMINGVPVNDMENGWVYWSNWDGVGDATQSIQVQRGLSAVNLATPSIGGTMNVVTEAAAMEPGISLKQEFGSDGFLKTTLHAATGLIGDKFALSALGVRKIGDGYYDGTWVDAWAYHLAASYIINDANRLEFFALGAPQRHGQNQYKQNAAAYSHELARELGYSDEALAAIPEAGRRWNENVSPVSCSYDGRQAVGDDTFERHDCGFLNERENFYHKPQVNLNWYSQLTDRLFLSTVAYYSGGQGGGTGTAGDMVWDYSGPSRVVDYDATIAMNRGTTDAEGNPKPAGASVGVLRNSRNNQWTVGAISKLRIDVSEPVTVQVGLDWRTAEIEHYYEVRDLLGGDYFPASGDNEFWPAGGVELRHGDKFNYFNTNTVDWFGGFVQGEYATGRFTAYGMGGLSTIKYSYTDHFRRAAPGSDEEYFVETDNIWGYQIKGGGLYNVNDQVGVFANAGYVSKVPIFDGVINDGSGVMNPDPKNETFISFEVGANFRSSDGRLNGKLNVYRTTWNDRTVTRLVTDDAGNGGLVNLLGLDALHQGIELELAYQPMDLLRFDAAASLGDWRYTDDVSGTYAPESDPSDITEYNFYVKDLKVGDAPQTQFAYSVSVFPIDGLYVQAVGKTFANHYAEFNPADRTDPADRAQSWKVPGYTIFDLHVGYDLPLRSSPVRARLFANVFNALDELYVQDALDNSSFNAFTDNGVNHSADDAEVYIGMPRTINVGISLQY
ncbi:MAG TPA: TonB-dependent receptor [Longimicrobiales bacterium]